MSEQDENPWEGYDPKTPKQKPAPGKLAALASEIDSAGAPTRSAPGWMWVAQFAAIAYILVNVGFMYTSWRSPAAGYVAAYMLPLTVLLLLLIAAMAEWKKQYTGEEK